MNNNGYDDMTATVNVNHAPAGGEPYGRFAADDRTVRARQAHGYPSQPNQGYPPNRAPDYSPPNRGYIPNQAPNYPPRPNQGYMYNEPIPRSVYEQRYTADNSKKFKTVSKAVTVLLSILLFFTTTFSLVIYDTRNAMKVENLEKLMEDVPFTELLVELGVTTQDECDDFYNDVGVLYGVEMDDDSMNSFIDNSNIKSYFANELADFCSDFFNGRSAKIVLTKSDVLKLFKENQREFRKEFGLYATIGLMTEIVEYMLDGENRVVILDSEDLEDEYPTACSLARVGLSYAVMVGLIILSVAIIAIRSIRKLSHGACGTGTAFVILGLLALAVTFVAPVLIGSSSIATLVGNFMMLNIIPTVILLVLGVALLIVGGILKKRSK